MYDIIALDPGFGNIKSISNNKEHPFVTPNATSYWTEVQQRILPSRNIVDGLSVETNEGKFMLGNVAVRQDPFAPWSGNEQRFDLPASRAHILAHMALNCTNKTLQPVKVVLGLPVSYMNQENAIAKWLKNTHAVKLYFDGVANEVQTIRVDEVKILPQPLGSVVYWMLKDDSQVASSSLVFADNTIGISDIGCRTHDLYVLTDREPITKGCTSTDSGMYEAYLQVKEEAGLKVGDQQLPKICRAGTWNNKDLGEYLEKAYSRLAETISQELATRWARLDIAQYVFVGGGAVALKPWLEKYYPKAWYGNELTNLWGFMRYGNWKWAKV